MAKLKVEIPEAVQRLAHQRQAGETLAEDSTEVADDSGLEAWLEQIRRWRSLTSEMLGATYEGEDEVAEFNQATSSASFVVKVETPGQRLGEGRREIERGVSVLASLGERLTYAQAPDLSDANSVTSAVPPDGGSGDRPAAIFVVHGHSEILKHQVTRVIERSTGLDVTILGEEEVAGLTLLEKFERFAGDADFAVVLLTADDRGRPVGDDEWRDRARQNVVFEMGWFYGRLGRECVAAIYDESVELPSDLGGLAYIPHDPSGAWKQRLGKQMTRAGFDVDFSRMP